MKDCDFVQKIILQDTGLLLASGLRDLLCLSGHVLFCRLEAYRFNARLELNEITQHLANVGNGNHFVTLKVPVKW